ncbi:MAG: hypothetical protein GY870_11945 [archaeon]|nr:hypothetical protein [archaeon]
MPNYTFKLMGALGESGIKNIKVGDDPNQTVGDVKEMVRREYKFPPNMKVSFIIEGKSLNEDHHKWNLKMISTNTTIMVIGTRS